MHWSTWAIALNVMALARADEAPEGFPEDHIDLVIPMKVKFDSHLRQADLPPHFITANETNLVPLTLRMETRRKRCSCGCSGCDLFPNRSCCSSSCCSSQKPLPLACCPPPPPPKPCCQPAFGPCCPATPNCCPKPCCRGRRPEYEEYEDEEGNPGGVPAPPNPPRTCCPPPTPAAPPPPPPPPPPAPEAPTQCCPSQPYGRTPCRSGCPNGDCGCGRPCCYYQNPTCCNQGQRACCPPEQPCCPELKLDNCLAAVPPCLRACPSCPCRKRLLLGKRTKRAAPGLHCQPISLLGQQSPPTLISQPVKTIVKAKAAGTKTATSTVFAAKKLIEQSEDHVEAPPTAGRLYDFRRAHVRVKRNLDGNGGCQLCINGTPLKRTKRSFDCVPCTYLQPQYSDWNPFLGDQRPQQQSPIGTPLAGHKRTKRAGCLPHPQCTLHVRRYKRNLIGSQYCEPCNGHYGRKKREAERDQCLRREKRYADEQCDNDEFSINERSKRQAYNPKGILDIVKLLSKASSGGNNPGGCMKFPACVLAQKKRRKRNADRMDKYYRAVEEHKKQVEEYEKALEEHKRVKRQFFAPDNAAACVPCPAWVTLALASRKKREADDKENGTTSKQMTISEAIADIRAKKGYKEGFEEDDEEDSSEETIEMRRKQRRSCEQSDDCLNNVEYAVFQKVYAEKRTKREAVFRRKKCTRCGVSGMAPRRVKRNFGQPNINVSEQNCMAFPQCRHRVKRNLFGEDCNICTADAGVKRRRKRNFGTAQCYPCPGTRS